MGLFSRKSDEIANERRHKEEQEFKEKMEGRLGFVKVDEQSETTYNSNLMIVGAHLTQICHPNGGSPEEILATYTKMMEGLIDWFNVVPLKEKLEGMLEETIWSRWAVKEQPVVPTYMPWLQRRQMGSSTDTDDSSKPSGF